LAELGGMLLYYEESKDYNEHDLESNEAGY
jgi:hypothetical protein